MDDSNAPFYRWFVGGITSTFYNVVDRWAEEFLDKAAYIWYSELGKEENLVRFFFALVF